MIPAALTFFALANAWHLAAIAFRDDRSAWCWFMATINMVLTLANALTHGVNP